MSFTSTANFVAASSQYLLAPATPTVDFTGNGTIEAWLNFASSVGGNNPFIGSRSMTGGATSGFQWYTIAGDFIEFDMVSGSNLTSVVSTAPYVIGTWMHVAIVADGANVKMYINGALDATATGTQNDFPASDEQMSWGTFYEHGSDQNPIFHFDGSIGLARLWSVVRTGPQILANYCTPLGPTAGLNGEWMSDGTLNDTSGNGNTLTNINGVTFPLGIPSTCAVVTPTFTAGNRRIIM